MSKSKKNEEVMTSEDVETSTVVTPEVSTEVAKRKPGRPADPAKKAAREAKKTGKRGRPVVEGSERQIKLAEYAAKKEAGLIKQGRPKMDPIAKLEQQAAKLKAKAEAKISEAIALGATE